MGDRDWSEFIETPPQMFVSPAFLADDYQHGQSDPTPDFLQPPDVHQCSELFSNGQNTQSVSVQPAEFSEIENRALLITNIPPNAPQTEIDEFIVQRSAVRSVDVSGLSRGIITVEYYDLRDAQSMKRSRNGSRIAGSPVSVCFAPLQPIIDQKNPPNNGTIVVFHLPTTISEQHIEELFQTFGDIRQIRATPTKPTQRFIEYWDVRASEEALARCNGKYVMGSRLSIEFSLPGGFRKSMQRPDQSGPGRR